MSIANELSSDVAAAVLASTKDESAHDASELAKVVKEVHSTLRRLTAEARRTTRRRLSSTGDSSPASDAAASGAR